LNNSLKAITGGLDTTLDRIPDAGLVTPFDSAATWAAGPPERLGAGPSTNAPRSASARDLLTRRELEVLEMVADGRTNAAIASRLVITEGTVKQHVKHILRKLRVQNRAEAVSRLYQAAP
jgi:DNA-binding NarL/FixJ family response regulator